MVILVSKQLFSYNMLYTTHRVRLSSQNGVEAMVKRQIYMCIFIVQNSTYKRGIFLKFLRNLMDTLKKYTTFSYQKHKII